MGFEDESINIYDRYDHSYTANFYTDDELAGSYEVKRGDLPKDVEIAITDCDLLVIEITQPEDSLLTARVNLFDFVLH